MSAEGIKAGRAYIELGLKDRLSAGLKAAKERLGAWAQGLALLGTGVTGFGPLHARRGMAKVGQVADSVWQ